jgi:hypothetical protein
MSIISLCEPGDGENLKCTFRRCVDSRLFDMWEELVNLVSTVELTEDEDALIWQFQSNGVYSSQSLYSVINFRGVTPVFVPAVSKLRVPPRVHFFLWLLSKNKILTRDNLEKRRKLDDTSYVFCSERETACHLFFGCVVAKRAWQVISQVLCIEVHVDYESVARLWLCNKKHDTANMVTSAVFWSIWKLRNAMIFQGVAWLGMKPLWQRVVPMLRCWRVLVPIVMEPGNESAISQLERVMAMPEVIGS